MESRSCLYYLRGLFLTDKFLLVQALLAILAELVSDFLDLFGQFVSSLLKFKKVFVSCDFYTLGISSEGV